MGAQYRDNGELNFNCHRYLASLISRLEPSWSNVVPSSWHQFVSDPLKTSFSTVGQPRAVLSKSRRPSEGFGCTTPGAMPSDGPVVGAGVNVEVIAPGVVQPKPSEG